MTRHARNNTAGAVYSYHERQKDTKTSGYGTQKARMGKDSIKDYDACNLTLQPCREPMVTRDGYLYDKEAVYEYIIHQKAEIARKLKEFDKQKKKDIEELEMIADAERRSQCESFLSVEKGIVKSLPSASSVGSGIISNISNMSEGRDKHLPSFWVPSMTPESKKTKLKKPDTVVYCPMSGKTLKIKDLIPVKFTRVNDDDSKPNVSSLLRKEKYKCAVSHDILNNSIPLAVIRPSGCVVTMECVEKLIRKDMLDPINGAKLTEKDIIPLQRGGTGFSSTNDLNAAIKRPVMMV